MLKKIILENYRCFEKSEIPFRDLSIIIGKNNAGKSTLIEALRILSIVVNRRNNILFQKAPRWVMQQESILGISPSINNLDISTRNIFYMYGDPPATIHAEFEDGTNIFISIGENAEIFATIRAANNAWVESRAFARSLKIPSIDILPQISPLREVEELIRKETVHRNQDTYLSSRNFRNQLYYYPEAFQRFKQLAEATWAGLSIHNDPTSIRTQGDLFLFVRDNKFEAEIGWMGHGLQMWLQTMWFLSRCETNSTVILDEPDVYMHADLQRRLIRLVRREYKQVIIATHSIEIMSDVEPMNILPIINTRRKMLYANNAPIVQKIIDEIGSVHNIEIARLFSYKKLLIVEGEKEDVKLLTIFQSKLFPETFEPFDVLPKMFIEGWGGWQRVLGSSKFFRDNRSEMRIYCLFDSDYHVEEEKNKRISDAESNQINLHIWSKKEIENYLLLPTVIHRLISKKKRKDIPSLSQVCEKLDELCNSLKDDVIDNYATEFHNLDKSAGTKPANKKARDLILPIWEEQKLSLVCGKTMITSLSSWLQENFKISIDKFSIAREFKNEEIFHELATLISKIEKSEDL